MLNPPGDIILAMIRTIAIDGPAASGKSVVGRLLAEKLGYWFLDTGIMYRAVTWLALERGISPDDADALSELTESVQVRPVSRYGGEVEIEGRTVGPELRVARVDSSVSNVSRHPVVRSALVRQQRLYADAVLDNNVSLETDVKVEKEGKEASGGGIVMIGRDIGTVVLPGADLKIFLTASAEERARRRCNEMLERGWKADLPGVQEDIEKRDAIDSSREDSPLRPADDACQLDTSDLSVEQVVDSIANRTATHVAARTEES